MMKRKRKERRQTRHHLTAKSNQGNNHKSNIILMWRNRHSYFHSLFGNRSLEEIINVLLRLKKFKDQQGRGKHGNVVEMTVMLQECIDNGYKLPQGWAGDYRGKLIERR